MTNQRNKGKRMLDQLKEYIGDNEAGLKALQEAQAKWTELENSNRKLAEGQEHWEREAKNAFAKRDEFKTKAQELEEKLTTMPKDNSEFEKQFGQLKSDYENKLQALQMELGSTKSKLVETARQAEFAKLNLAAKLPKGMSEDAVQSAVEFMQYDLSRQGLDFDAESNSFVFKREGVNAINPNTSKPYTLAEMAENRIKSGAWDMFVNTTANPQGAGRGNADSAGGQPQRAVVNRTSFEEMSQAQRHSFIKDGGKVIE